MILKRKKYGLLKRVSTGVDRFICVTCQRVPPFRRWFCVSSIVVYIQDNFLEVKWQKMVLLIELSLNNLCFFKLSW